MATDVQYIVALDQGTTSSRAIIFNKQGVVIGIAQREFTQIYPKAGWVEHNAMEIWATQSAALTEVLAKTGINSEQVAAIGITNQRETTVVWNKHTGRPVYNAIVWQCRRTAAICEQLKAKGLEDYIKKTTGLVVDAYFSGTKLKWILDNVEGVRDQAEQGDLLFGTIDTWLTWKFTNGRVHVTDYSNASRTLLFDITRLKWDEKMLKILNIPPAMLPQVKSSSEIYGQASIGSELGASIPIAGIAGDQQAALFGQMCFEKGMAKNTYGTGCFLLMHTGDQPIQSKHGLLTTIAWGIDNKITYALEGSVFMAGAAVQWLRDQLGLVQDAADTDYYASKVEDTNGVYVVPAFVGLGAPYWDPYARGSIFGLTRGANRNHIIRATLEAIAYQSRDLLDVMQREAYIELTQLRVDGGAVANDFLMQFQADILGKCVIRPEISETTASGVAYLAGLAVGFWRNANELKNKLTDYKEFQPSMGSEKRAQLYNGWKKAIACSRAWGND
ncbi:MAG: glycerol kinase GlpK [Endozoicomonas sp. (ex Botrylloides leachii)]|nr:glycerol kinase GlpK [Endozoicomonas sp. (ex Botrylloides leachii)]